MKTIPKNEIIWETCIRDNCVYYITSKDARDMYYIYRIDDNGVIKLGKNLSPNELKKKYCL